MRRENSNYCQTRVEPLSCQYHVVRLPQPTDCTFQQRYISCRTLRLIWSKATIWTCQYLLCQPHCPFWSVRKPKPREWLQVAEGILYFLLYNMLAGALAVIFLACGLQYGVKYRHCAAKTRYCKQGKATVWTSLYA